MIIDGIDFPDELTDHIASRNLVVFAGAGVSFGPPSSLPLYADLAKELAKGTGKQLTQGYPIERFIGSLEIEIDVKQKTIDRIKRSSGHNPIHEHIVTLFGKIDNVKIVTTNYDYHFESACKSKFGSVPECYHSPALPLGSSFSGIVHVHGSIRDKSGIVLTDADFGRAYLTEGWARRFLVDLFYSHNVLFIGYSHEDTVMTYLARALPTSQEARRFALEIGQGSKEKWSSLGIVKIPFGTGIPADFDIQTRALGSLAEHVNRSLLDWGTKIGKIISQKPPEDKAEVSQLLHALRDTHVCRIFVEHSPSAEWLSWLHENGRLDFLFAAKPWSQSEAILSHWIAHGVLKNNVQAILHLIAHHKKINDQFWMDLCRGARVIAHPCDRRTLAALLGFLVESHPAAADEHCLSSISDAAKSHDLPWISFAVFKKLCSTFLLVELNKYNLHGSDTIHVSLKADSRGSEYVIMESFKHFHDSSEAFDRHVIDFLSVTLLERHLCHARWGGEDGYTFDPDSYGRSAIEKHEQDRYHRDFYAIVDAFRDSCARYSKVQPEIMRLWCLSSLTADAAIVRRVALHTASLLSWPNIDLLIDAVTAHCLEDVHARHEIFELLRQRYGLSSHEARVHLISGIFASCKFDKTNPDDVGKAHAAFQWLHWIGHAHPDCGLIADEIRFILSRHPRLKPREHPDLSHYSTSRWGGDPSPYSTEHLLSMTPNALVGLLDTPELKEIERGNFWDQVSAAVAKDSAWGLALLTYVRANGHLSQELGSAVVKGIVRWLESELYFGAAAETLKIPEITKAHAALVSSALYNVVKQNPQPHVKQNLNTLDEVALIVWNAIVDDPAPAEGSPNWVSRSINSTAGTIAEYHVNALSVRANMNEKEPQRGIPDACKSMLETMVHGGAHCNDMARPVIASQCGFLVFLDAEFARKVIIPLFSDADIRKADQAWHGFLTWGNLTRSYVEDMRTGFEYVQQHLLHGFPDDLAQRFVHYMHSAAVMLESSPALSWSLSENLQSADSLREALARSSFSVIEDAPPEIIAEQWKGWISRYWIERFNNNPVPLSDAELEIYLDNISDMGDTFPATVDLLKGCPPHKLEHSHVFMRLLDNRLHLKYTKSVFELILYVFRCKRPTWGLFQLDVVLRDLIPRLDNMDDKRAVANESIRAGVLTADEANALVNAPRPPPTEEQTEQPPDETEDDNA